MPRTEDNWKYAWVEISKIEYYALYDTKQFDKLYEKFNYKVMLDQRTIGWIGEHTIIFIQLPFPHTSDEVRAMLDEE